MLSHAIGVDEITGLMMSIKKVNKNLHRHPCNMKEW